MTGYPRPSNSSSNRMLHETQDLGNGMVRIRQARDDPDLSVYRQISFEVYEELGAAQMITADSRFKPGDDTEVHLLELGTETVGGFMIVELTDPVQFWNGLLRSDGPLPNPQRLLDVGRVFLFARLAIRARFRGNFHLYGHALDFVRCLKSRKNAAYALAGAVLPWRVHILYDSFGFQCWSPPWLRKNWPNDTVEDAPANKIYMAYPLTDAASKAFRPSSISRSAVDQVADAGAKILVDERNALVPTGASKGLGAGRT